MQYKSKTQIRVRLKCYPTLNKLWKNKKYKSSNKGSYDHSLVITSLCVERLTYKTWKTHQSFFSTQLFVVKPDLCKKMKKSNYQKRTQYSRSLTAWSPGIHTIRHYRGVWQGQAIITQHYEADGCEGTVEAKGSVFSVLHCIVT